MIMDGELDHLPEAAFNLKGTIEQAIEAGKSFRTSKTIIICSRNIICRRKDIQRRSRFNNFSGVRRSVSNTK